MLQSIFNKLPVLSYLCQSNATVRKKHTEDTISKKGTISIDTATIALHTEISNRQHTLRLAYQNATTSGQHGVERGANLSKHSLGGLHGRDLNDSALDLVLFDDWF